MGRLVILSGPSCVGKSPLRAALKRLHPDLAASLKRIVLHNDRRPRPGEQDGIDYHFRSRAEIEKLRKNSDFAVMEVRGDLQALDLADLRRLLASGDAFFEGNCFAACALLEQKVASPAETVSAFMSPLSAEELRYLADPSRGVTLSSFVTELMRRKLLRRTTKQKGVLSAADLADIERRAASAFDEMKHAWRFQHVMVNHDGEDSENWEGFYYPLGDARKALTTFVDLLEVRPNPSVEKWRKDDPI
jgi:guanylate kinase